MSGGAVVAGGAGASPAGASPAGASPAGASPAGASPAGAPRVEGLPAWAIFAGVAESDCGNPGGSWAAATALTLEAAEADAAFFAVQVRWWAWCRAIGRSPMARGGYVDGLPAAGAFMAWVRQAMIAARAERCAFLAGQSVADQTAWSAYLVARGEAARLARLEHERARLAGRGER